MKLTWHFGDHHFLARSANGDLQWSDVERSHVIFTTSLVVVVDYVLSDIVIRSWILDLSLSSSVVYHEYYDEDWSFSHNTTISIAIIIKLQCKVNTNMF